MLPLELSDPDHPHAGKPEIFLATPADESSPAFSPDGRWVAYSSNELGRLEVFVRPFVGGAAPGAGRTRVSVSGGENPVWSYAGRQLSYQTRDRQVMVVDYDVAAGSFQPKRPRPWAEHATRTLKAEGGPKFDLSPDGKRLLILAEPERVEETAKGNLHVTMLIHWFDEVRQRIPTR